MFSMVQVNRIYLIFNLVHFLVDSSVIKKRKKIFFSKKKYMKNSKPNSLVLSYGRL